MSPQLAADRPRLKGDPDDVPVPQPKASGWHPVEWVCEFAGTGFQLFDGFGVVAALESTRSPLPSSLSSAGGRLALIGAAFSALAAVVAISPLGRRSGAHLNPAVTLAFVLRGHTPVRDALGYVVAQVAGAVVAAAGFTTAWNTWARSVEPARTAPEPGLAAYGVAAIEAALTFGLMLTVFSMLSSARTAR